MQFHLSFILPHLDCIRINCNSSKLTLKFHFALYVDGVWCFFEEKCVFVLNSCTALHLVRSVGWKPTQIASEWVLIKLLEIYNKHFVLLIQFGRNSVLITLLLNRSWADFYVQNNLKYMKYCKYLRQNEGTFKWGKVSHYFYTDVECEHSG